MTEAFLLSHVGLALVYAAFGTPMLYLVTCVALPGSARRLAPTFFALLFFVFLTQCPFPDPKALAVSCPLAAAQPNFVPLAFIDYEIERWHRFQPLYVFLREASAVGYAMNFLLCALIGALLARHRIGAGSAILTGFVLSAAIELTQLTAIWGLYPCPYRKFDVDDILLNTLGVAAGLCVTRLISHAPSTRVP